ncbi:hypothetical protein ACMATS_04270 [Streptoverticillium reticulum]|uniref:hypothetical protein n=1 Tax=Streptoverticillium reticulum TaxID=1433415 RepID=UPI0039BFFF4F
MPPGRTVKDRKTRYFAFVRADRIRKGDAVLDEGVFRTVCTPPAGEQSPGGGQVISIALEDRETPLCTRPPVRFVVRRLVVLSGVRREGTR